MPDKPKIKLDGYANCVRIETENANGKDCVTYKAEKFDGSYSEHAASANNVFVEMVDKTTTTKYAGAFIEDGAIGQRVKDLIRPGRPVEAVEPAFSGMTTDIVTPQPPIFTGGHTVEIE